MPNDWSADFRYPAMRASMRLAEAHPQASFAQFPFSFCLPVSDKPVAAFVTPGRIALLFLVMGFGGLLAELAIEQRVEKDNPQAWQWHFLAISCSLTGILCFLVPAVMQARINQVCIGDRAKRLIARREENRLHCCELGDSANPRISIDADDNVVVLVDYSNRKLLIEGTAATYQILATDVVRCEVFEFMSYCGADITCRIDAETVFRFGLAKVSMIKEIRNQLPLLVFLDHWITNDILDSVTEGLGLGQSTGRV